MKAASAVRNKTFALVAALFTVALPSCGYSSSGEPDTAADPAGGTHQQTDSAATVAASPLQRYENSDRYVIYDIDVNIDGVPDKVVSSAQNAGNELLFFVNRNGSFKLALTSINLTEDGGRILGGIRQAPSGKGSDVLSIETYFPQGHDIARHYVSFQNNQWILSRTEYEASDWRERPALVYLCEVAQGIPVESLVSAENAPLVRQLPDESLRQKECRIKH